MTNQLKNYIKLKAKSYFSIPKKCYVNAFKIDTNSYLITYYQDEIEHKHILTIG